MTETRTCYLCDRVGTPGSFVYVGDDRYRCNGRVTCQRRQAQVMKDEEEAAQ